MNLFKSNHLFTAFLLCFSFDLLFSQTDSIYSTPFNKKRLTLVVGTETALYASSLYGLNELWYKDYPRSSFHLFDDSKEWLQMDKVGHTVTSYYIGRVGIGLMKWSGVERKKAIWYGGMLGSLYQSTIEVLDGYSTEWGFSIADLATNTVGSLMVVGQELAWDEQRIVLKYSFQESKFSKYRPNILGSNFQENMLKDYNGQTYWLSVNPSSFMGKESKFPKWLNIAIGYGAEGMTGGENNPVIFDANGNPVFFERYRQYYLSLDVDLTRIKTRSKFLRTIFYSVGFIKIPAPAMEFTKNGINANWLGF
ncbi:MAG: hypothetical protein A3F72_10585 [Bacteroidetes bacterium RIFCSPLOWO2_12_FULL_35_15]|nr:MAG: hypothetical protein A3F72_10585 [Bacteroidetes bacterium RIFCSPLOWO2_12_FULL_35_15]